MSDFKSHHNIDDSIAPPIGHISPHHLLSYIAELMAQSMGPENHKALLEECEDYKQGLPFDLR